MAVRSGDAEAVEKLARAAPPWSWRVHRSEVRNIVD